MKAAVLLGLLVIGVAHAGDSTPIDPPPNWHVNSSIGDGTVLGKPVPEYHRPAFSVAFKPLSFETAAQELSWQGLNVVDMFQTIQIAKNGQCFQEVGTLSFLTGPHPSERSAIGGSILFGVLHYGGTRLIENLVDENPNYRILQRIWGYGGLLLKGQNDWHNHQIGLGLDSSRSCVR